MLTSIALFKVKSSEEQRIHMEKSGAPDEKCDAHQSFSVDFTKAIYLEVLTYM